MCQSTTIDSRRRHLENRLINFINGINMNKWNQLPNPSVVTDASNVPVGEQRNLTLFPVLTNFHYLMYYYPHQPQLIISPGGGHYWDFDSRKWRPIPNGSGNSWGNFLFGFLIALLFLLIILFANQ